MEKTITTALFIAVSMIMVIALFNVAYPAVIQGGEAVTSMSSNVADRMKYQIAVIHATSELDNARVAHDLNLNGLFDVFGWVKNIGDARIIALNQMDVFFGPEGNYTRIAPESQAQGNSPYWTAQVEGGGDWQPTATLQIAIHYHGTLARGRYFMKVILSNGVSAEYFLGL